MWKLYRKPVAGGICYAWVEGGIVIGARCVRPYGVTGAEFAPPIGEPIKRQGFTPCKTNQTQENLSRFYL